MKLQVVSRFLRRGGLKWRSSVWFVTFIVGLGVTVDLLVYSIIIPVLPFQLEHLGYGQVSAKVGWLLFAYSAGLVISTPPIAALSERYQNRKYPLIAGQVFLIGSQILLMEAPTYWLMVIARVLQGISSSMIWVVGLALLCDTVPEVMVGRQLGIAMMGLSLGILIGPPVGGALYSKFGFRGPFILGILATVVDLIGRLLIIERKEALVYMSSQEIPEKEDNAAMELQDISLSEHNKTDAPVNCSQENDSPPVATASTTYCAAPPSEVNGLAAVEPSRTLSLLGVVLKLLRSPRAVTVSISTLVYGIVYSAQEPVIPLYLQSHWGLNSSKVGLVYLAAVIPTFFSSPLSGWWADRKGTEWIVVLILWISIPWWVLITIHSSLAYFIVMLAIQSFFMAAIVSPLTAELAAVSRTHAGVGYAHVYGAFNLSYGIGAALGPIISGQMYDHLSNGWTAICLLGVGLIAASSILALCWTGDRPLLGRLSARLSRDSQERDTNGISRGEA